MPKRLILASASPRRSELLALLRLPFDVQHSGVDENADSSLMFASGRASDYPPSRRVEVLAREKAQYVWHQNRNDAVVVAADTLVVTSRPGLDSALGKPADEEDARRMLAMLSAGDHSVFTGVALAYPDEDARHGDLIVDCRIASEVVDTQVRFRELTPELIDAYIATGEPFDKAGAYGIQGFASAFVEAIYGDYFNVVGLPIHTVAKMLERIGIEWWRGPDALE